MKSTSVTVSKRGYIVLPAHIRKEMNIKPGAKLLITGEKGRITLETIPSFTQKLSGLTQKTIGVTSEVVDAYIDQERNENGDQCGNNMLLFTIDINCIDGEK